MKESFDKYPKNIRSIPAPLVGLSVQCSMCPSQLFIAKKMRTKVLS